MLELQNITAGYKKTAVLNNLNTTCAKNKVYALIGKSGCGKTTLFKAICGFIPHEGQIFLNGAPLDIKKQRIALLPQKNSLVKWQTLRQNIMLPLKLRGAFAPSLFNSITRELGITKLLDKYPNHVSGGERQRAAVARAFLACPDLLLLDEPFSALDINTKEDVHKLFLKVLQNRRVTTLLITHDIAEALYLAEKILVLKDGGITACVDNPLFGQENAKQDLYPTAQQTLKELL